MVYLNYYLLSDSFVAPEYGTTKSACFDLRFQTEKDEVQAYHAGELPFPIKIFENPGGEKFVEIPPGNRALIPTGTIFEIQNVGATYSIRLHIRSSLALKRGLFLANGEGVIDSDYQEEVFAIIHNGSPSYQKIYLGERIVQGEIVQNEFVHTFKVNQKPSNYLSERNGGFGSTGTGIYGHNNIN